MSAFEKLNAINVNDKIEKKNGLSYLSWAWAWGEIKKVCPDANYTIYENAQGWCYHTDGKTCWVKTGVTADGIEHVEYLPVMDMRNKSIPADNVTSFDVNKAIQRSLTKAVARHGLGLYIYAGEDLPDGEEKVLEPKPVSHNDRIKKLLDHHKITLKDFGLILSELQSKGDVPNEDMDSMDDTEFGKALALIHTSLLKSGTQTKIA